MSVVSPNAKTPKQSLMYTSVSNKTHSVQNLHGVLYDLVAVLFGQTCVCARSLSSKEGQCLVHQPVWTAIGWDHHHVGRPCEARQTLGLQSVVGNPLPGGLSDA